MGRFLKTSASLGSATAQAVKIPKGNSSKRPTAPSPGDIRFNTDVNAVEFFNGTEFVYQAPAGEVDLTFDHFTGDGSTTTFTMSSEPTHAKQIMVFIGSVYQDYITAYTTLEDDITFTSAPPNGEVIKVIHGLSSTDTVTSSV